MHWLVALIIAVASPAETAVVRAALDAYFGQMHGGSAIAFPNARRPVRLDPRTMRPSKSQMAVRVASPGNRAGADAYTGLDPVQVTDLLVRSAKPVRLPSAPAHFRIASGEVGDCGPVADDARFVDAVRVSRPGYGKSNDALIYMEYAGGGRAYYLQRKAGKWQVVWYVELWACG